MNHTISLPQTKLSYDNDKCQWYMTAKLTIILVSPIYGLCSITALPILVLISPINAWTVLYYRIFSLSFDFFLIIYGLNCITTLPALVLVSSISEKLIFHSIAWSSFSNNACLQNMKLSQKMKISHIFCFFCGMNISIRRVTDIECIPLKMWISFERYLWILKCIS